MALCAMVAASCGLEIGALDAESEEVVGVTSQAVLGTGCSSASQNNCWQRGYTGPNYSTFDFGPHLGCGVVTAGNGMGGYTYRKVNCGTMPGLWGNVLGYGLPNAEAPNDIKSIAVDYWSHTDVRINILGSDNVVRVAYGNLNDPWFGGTNFSTYFYSVSPVTNTGSSICLKKIVSAWKPNRYTASRTTLGLSCTGGLFVAGWNGSAWVWFPASSIAPFHDLPAGLTYSDMGDSWVPGDTHPLYLLTTGGRVYRIGGGSMAANGIITWWAHHLLPQIVTPSGTTVTPIAVGGSFVITNAGGGGCPGLSQPCNGDDDRFYQFSNATFTWVRLNTGTSTIPGSLADQQAGQASKGIVDASAWRTSNGHEMGVWHHNHRIDTYSWP